MKATTNNSNPSSGPHSIPNPYLSYLPQSSHNPCRGASPLLPAWSPTPPFTLFHHHQSPSGCLNCTCSAHFLHQGHTQNCALLNNNASFSTPQRPGQATGHGHTRSKSASISTTTSTSSTSSSTTPPSTNGIHINGLSAPPSPLLELELAQTQQQLTVCQIQLRDAFSLAQTNKELAEMRGKLVEVRERELKAVRRELMEVKERELKAVRKELEELRERYEDVVGLLEESLEYQRVQEVEARGSDRLGSVEESESNEDEADEPSDEEQGFDRSPPKEHGPIVGMDMDMDIQNQNVLMNTNTMPHWDIQTPQTPPASIKRDCISLPLPLPTPPTTPGRELGECEASSASPVVTSAPLPTPSPEVPPRDLSSSSFSPSCSSSPSSSPSPSSSSHTDSPAYEIFVDSSGWGIGFVLNGRWLAWPLKPNWSSPGSGRDNNWAEMVAVELGLRTLISAGIHHKSILIRSDNIGVVQALKTSKTKHVRQKEVLRTVEGLCRGSELDISVKWVDTKNNKADRPSRGMGGSKKLLFPTQLEVPMHFEEFLGERVS